MNNCLFPKFIYDSQILLVQFSDQRKKISPKSKLVLKLIVFNITLLKASNIKTDHKSTMVWNKTYGFKIRVAQFTDQEKL